jgi:predicted transposase YbfD/YdcC
VSAFEADSALVLGHIEVDDKSNEIPAIERLVGELGLASCLVTADAMHGQKSFQRAAVADCRLIIQAKSNQPGLLASITQLCRIKRPASATTASTVRPDHAVKCAAPRSSRWPRPWRW